MEIHFLISCLRNTFRRVGWFNRQLVSSIPITLYFSLDQFGMCALSNLLFSIIILIISPCLISSYGLLFLELFCKCQFTHKWCSFLTAPTGFISIVECNVLLYLSTICLTCLTHSFLSRFKASNLRCKFILKV